MIRWHNQVNGHEFEQTPGDGEGQGSLACCSPWGRKELDMTKQQQKKTKTTTNGKKQTLTLHQVGPCPCLNGKAAASFYNPNTEVILHPFCHIPFIRTKSQSPRWHQWQRTCLPMQETRRCERGGFDPWVGKIPWRRAWQPTSVF